MVRNAETQFKWGYIPIVLELGQVFILFYELFQLIIWKVESDFESDFSFKGRILMWLWYLELALKIEQCRFPYWRGVISYLNWYYTIIYSFYSDIHLSYFSVLSWSCSAHKQFFLLSLIILVFFKSTLRLTISNFSSQYNRFW